MWWMWIGNVQNNPHFKNKHSSYPPNTKQDCPSKSQKKNHKKSRYTTATFAIQKHQLTQRLLALLMKNKGSTTPEALATLSVKPESFKSNSFSLDFPAMNWAKALRYFGVSTWVSFHDLFFLLCFNMCDCVSNSLKWCLLVSYVARCLGQKHMLVWFCLVALCLSVFTFDYVVNFDLLPCACQTIWVSRSSGKWQMYESWKRVEWFKHCSLWNQISIRTKPS